MASTNNCRQDKKRQRQQQQQRQKQCHRQRWLVFMFTILHLGADVNAFHTSSQWRLCPYQTAFASTSMLSRCKNNRKRGSWSLLFARNSPLGSSGGDGNRKGTKDRARSTVRQGQLVQGQRQSPLRVFDIMNKDEVDTSSADTAGIRKKKSGNGQGKEGNDKVMKNVVDEAWMVSDDDANDGGNEFMKTEAILLLSAVAIIGGLISQNPTALAFAQTFVTNPTGALQTLVETIQSMGTDGYLYFAIFYTIAEVLAIPATPLTASAGYLFGVKTGTAIVLGSASIAAAISFLVGRTFLRSTVENLLNNYPEFKKLDKAIGKEGFKVILLLRLSPLFPFALSSYLYGVTSVSFWEYFFATVLGFAPGTIAYVYTGEVGRFVTGVTDGGDAVAQPWYVYLGGAVVLGGVLKVVADVATRIINELEEEEED